MSVTNESLSVDINVGLDYERARDQLNQDAGRAFSRYMRAKVDPTSTADDVAAARTAYIEADDEYRQLRRGRTASVAAILGGDQ